MCAKVKMLTAIDVLVNCTLVLNKHKYSNCIHCERFPLELLLEENRSTSAIQRLTEQSNQYGMVFNSDRCMATSLQPGITLAGNEASGHLFESILLTLRDIVNYYMGKVLNTPAASGIYHARQPCFFTPIDHILWPSSAQPYKTDESREICEPSCGGVEVLGRFPQQKAKYQQKPQGGHHG